MDCVELMLEEGSERVRGTFTITAEGYINLCAPCGGIGAEGERAQ